MSDGIRIGVVSTALPRRRQTERGNVIRPNLYYCQMASAAQSHHAEVMLFTPADVDWQRNKVNAWTPSQSGDPLGNWVRRSVSMPHVVYENVFVHLAIRGYATAFRKMAKQRHLPVFNPYLPGKWQMVKWIRESHLHRYQPKTHRLVADEEAIERIQHWGCAYVKPVGGYGGLGVTRIESLAGGHFRVSMDRTQGRNGKLRMETNEYGLLKLLKQRQTRPHLLQQGINLLTVNDRKVDFRVVVQRDNKGAWNLVGIVPKVAARDGVVTNLVAGGERVSLHTLIHMATKQETTIPVEGLKQCAIEIAEIISKRVPCTALLGFDLGADTSGKVYIIEMNPKPARSLLSPTMRKESAKYTVGFATWLAQK